MVKIIRTFLKFVFWTTPRNFKS